MKKGTARREAVPVPQSKAEAEEFLRRVGAAQRTIEEATLKLNKAVEKLTGETAEKVAPLQKQIDDLVDGLYVYAEAHRSELTDGDKTKTVELSTGRLSWRTSPPRVRLKNVQKVLAELVSRGLRQFIRKKDPEVDKEAMLKDRKLAESISGVSFDQEETFVVKPAEVGAEFTASTAKKLKVPA